MSSPRHYIFGIDDDGTYEFLHTALDKKGCIDYITKHQKVFPHRFKEYRYGQMCDEKSVWEVINNAQ